MDNHQKGLLGEQFISGLATKTFLSYWCYLNPHDELGDKKEICDLLILFRESCIICQVKNYEFKDNHERYFRKTVESAANQIQGAERKLFQTERDIFINHAVNGLVKFDRNKYSKVFRLILHLGSGLQYQNLGRLSKTNFQLIHTLGKDDFEHLLKELNTISDLVSYLKVREALCMKIDRILLCGHEKDLLGLYLKLGDGFKEFIAANEGQQIILDLENGWEEFESTRLDNDDTILHIENLIRDWVQSDLIIHERSRGLAEDLMSLNRHERRLFAVSLLEFNDKYMHKGHRRIIRRNFVLNDFGFVFFYYPKEMSNEKEPLMMIAAEGFSLHTNYTVTKMIVVGLCESENINFTLLDCSQLKNHKPEELKLALDHLGWFKEENFIHLEINMNKKMPDS